MATNSNPSTSANKGGRLRIGIKVPFAPNALVYARNLNEADAATVSGALATLKLFGFANGMTVGFGSIVASVTPN